MLNCDSMEQLLSRYVDGDLMEKDLQQVQAHLHHCLRCRERLEQLQQLHAFFQETPEFPEALHQKILDSIRRENEVSSSTSRHHHRLHILSTIASAACFLLLAAAVYLGQMPSTPFSCANVISSGIGKASYDLTEESAAVAEANINPETVDAGEETSEMESVSEPEDSGSNDDNTAEPPPSSLADLKNSLKEESATYGDTTLESRTLLPVSSQMAVGTSNTSDDDNELWPELSQYAVAMILPADEETPFDENDFIVLDRIPLEELFADLPDGILFLCTYLEDIQDLTDYYHTRQADLDKTGLQSALLYEQENGTGAFLLIPVT